MTFASNAPKALAVGAVLLGALTVTGPAAAADKTQIRHFVDCLGWMLSDPALHAANCTAGGAAAAPDGVAIGDAGHMGSPMSGSAMGSGGFGGLMGMMFGMGNTGGTGGTGGPAAAGGNGAMAGHGGTGGAGGSGG